MWASMLVGFMVVIGSVCQLHSKGHKHAFASSMMSLSIDAVESPVAKSTKSKVATTPEVRMAVVVPRSIQVWISCCRPSPSLQQDYGGK